MEEKLKKRIFYLDFIRALSTIFIIIFHFNCSMGSRGIYENPIIFYEYRNGNLGQIGVSLFFIISGAGLMISNQHKLGEGGDRVRIKDYLKKRWLTIFPMFYLAYFCVTCYYFIRYASLNPFGTARDKWTFVLTIFGMDGYLSPIIPNYYIIGEWFLGCIILFYFLFPLLCKLLGQKGPWIAGVCIFFTYILTTCVYNFEIYPIEYFALSRICEFFFGMFSVVYFQKIKRWHVCIAVIVVSIWSLCYIPLPQIHKTVIMGISLYVIFAYVGQHIPESYQHPFCSISRYSYPTYLLHHVILEQICSRFENIKLSLSETYFLFIVCIAVIMITTILFYNLYERIRNETKNMADIYESKI